MDETNQKIKLIPVGAPANDRLDRWIASLLPDLSRSAIRKLVDAGLILVDDKAVKSSHRVSPGETVSVRLPEPEPLDPLAEDIPLDIQHEDDWLLVVNKPPGMVVHPAGALRSGTLVNALLGHAQLSTVNGDLRPGIVHRLDKDTSGLLVVAKDDTTHRKLSAQLEAKEVSRRYVVVCWGHPTENAGTIETMINRSRRDRTRMSVSSEGRVAVTHYEVLGRYAFLSLLDVRLETGRTHQIRVHLDHIGHPVFGDPVYNGGDKRLKGISPLYRSKAATLLKGVERQMLHARQLVFSHPTTGAEMSFEKEPPEDMQEVLRQLEG